MAVPSEHFRVGRCPRNTFRPPNSPRVQTAADGYEWLTLCGVESAGCGSAGPGGCGAPGTWGVRGPWDLGGCGGSSDLGCRRLPFLEVSTVFFRYSLFGVRGPPAKPPRPQGPRLTPQVPGAPHPPDPAPPHHRTLYPTESQPLVATCSQYTYSPQTPVVLKKHKSVVWCGVVCLFFSTFAVLSAPGIAWVPMFH